MALKTLLKIIKIVINKLKKISFLRLDKTWVTFLIAGNWFDNFIIFNILKILNILNKNVSFNPGKINDGTNEIDHESFYIYDESESSEESWTNVNGC